MYAWSTYATYKQKPYIHNLTYVHTHIRHLHTQHILHNVRTKHTHNIHTYIAHTYNMHTYKTYDNIAHIHPSATYIHTKTYNTRDLHKKHKWNKKHKHAHPYVTYIHTKWNIHGIHTNITDKARTRKRLHNIHTIIKTHQTEHNITYITHHTYIHSIKCIHWITYIHKNRTHT